MNFQLILRGMVGILFLIALLLLLAGKIDYWQGWLFGLICLLIVTTISVFFGRDFSEIKERMKTGPGTKWWDILFWVIYGPMNMAIPVIAALDVGRFGWSGHLPSYLYIACYFLFISSALFHIWAIKCNRFYASTVRIQQEKQQTVITDGPYKYIRHPGYVGIILMVSNMALVLGSLWALIPAAMVAVLLIIRTALEDRTLRQELHGYQEYSHVVRYRLLPGIW